MYRIAFLSALFLLISPTWAALAHADEISAAPPAPEERVLDTAKGPQHYILYRRTNANGEKELIIEHEEIRKFFPGETKNPVLYGRDLDGDGRIDAWFYPDSSGMIQALDQPPVTSTSDPSSDSDDDIDGQEWAVASGILQNKITVSNRWLAGIVIDAVLSRLSFTQASSDSLERKLVEEEIDLRDLEVRVARLEKKDPHNRELLTYYTMLSDGWSDLSDQISREGIRDRFLYAAGDLAMYLVSAGLGKGAAKLTEWALPKLMATAPGVLATELYGRVTASLSEASSRFADRLSAKAADLGLDSDALAKFRKAIRWPAIAGAAQVVRESLAQRLSVLVKGLSSREKVAQLFLRSGALVKVAAKAALKQWKYIASTQAIQLGIEIYERRDTLFSPNPIVFAKRIFTDKDLLQDVGFMTWDSTVQTGVSAADPKVMRRMIICGILSFADSTGTSLLVKKDPDPGRNALDTGWEMVVGNAETQIDLAALKAFEKMATRSDNPKLALVGYLAAFIDDGIGYWAYDKVTTKYEQHVANAKPGKHLAWIPIFGQSQ